MVYQFITNEPITQEIFNKIADNFRVIIRRGEIFIISSQALDKVNSILRIGIIQNFFLYKVDDIQDLEKYMEQEEDIDPHDETRERVRQRLKETHTRILAVLDRVEKDAKERGEHATEPKDQKIS